MKVIVFVSFLIVIGISSCIAKDLLVGSSYNARIIWQGKANFYAIPFKKRVKQVFFSDPSQQIIKGIIARDVDHTESSATVTAGGVGFSFVNLRFKSERGGALNYHIEVYG